MVVGTFNLRSSKSFSPSRPCVGTQPQPWQALRNRISVIPQASYTPRSLLGEPPAYSVSHLELTYSRNLTS